MRRDRQEGSRHRATVIGGRRLRTIWLMTALLAAGPLASCGSVASLPAGPSVLSVTMSDYAFHMAGTIRRGRTVFQVRNTGHVTHEMVLVPLPADYPKVEPRPHPPGGAAHALATLAVFPKHAPGTSGSIAVDLTPGRYAMVCFVTDQDGVQHLYKGMQDEFRVG